MNTPSATDLDPGSTIKTSHRLCSPVSELIPRLERLEHLETSANMDDVLDFAMETGTSPFGRLVLNDIATRLAQRPDLQQRLLDTLETCYQAKVRDLNSLRRQFTIVRQLIPSLPEVAAPRMRQVLKR